MISLSPEQKLEERIKELTCFYDLLTIMQKEQTFEEALPQFTTIIAAAFLYAPDALVEIKLEPYHFFSKPTPHETVYLQNDLIVFNEAMGFIKVHYPIPYYKKNAFIPEELLLLNKVAVEISTFCEKKITRDRNALFERNAAHFDRLSILGEITAGIAHELNTPIGNILGFAELIQKQDCNAQVINDVSKIIKSAIYSREIVKKLMFFSCDMPQNAERIKLRPLFLQVLTLLEPNFKKSKVIPLLIFDESALEAQVDSVQLTQVLFNILINSIYAAPENSPITINVTHDSNNFYIDIADQGTGIDDSIKRKIFEPFFTTKPLGEGTGLGLSVVHGIIKSHKGSITAKDNLPSGVVLTISLPLNLKP